MPGGCCGSVPLWGLRVCAGERPVWPFFSGVWSGAAWPSPWWGWRGSAGCGAGAGNLDPWMNAGQQESAGRRTACRRTASRRNACRRKIGQTLPMGDSRPVPRPDPLPALPCARSRGLSVWSAPDASWWTGCPGRAPGPERPVANPVRALGYGRALVIWAAGWRTSSTGSWRMRTTGASPGRSPASPSAGSSAPRIPAAPAPAGAPSRPSRAGLLGSALAQPGRSKSRTGRTTTASAVPAGSAPACRPPSPPSRRPPPAPARCPAPAAAASPIRLGPVRRSR